MIQANYHYQPRPNPTKYQQIPFKILRMKYSPNSRATMGMPIEMFNKWDAAIEEKGDGTLEEIRNRGNAIRKQFEDEAKAEIEKKFAEEAAEGRPSRRMPIYPTKNGASISCSIIGNHRPSPLLPHPTY